MDQVKDDLSQLTSVAVNKGRQFGQLGESLNLMLL